MYIYIYIYIYTVKRCVALHLSNYQWKYFAHVKDVLTSINETDKFYVLFSIHEIIDVFDLGNFKWKCLLPCQKRSFITDTLSFILP